MIAMQSSRTSRLRGGGRCGRVAALILVLVAAAGPVASRADTLEAALLKQAPRVIGRVYAPKIPVFLVIVVGDILKHK